MTQILATINAYLTSVQVPKKVEGQQAGAAPARDRRSPSDERDETAPEAEPERGLPSVESTIRAPQIINLIRVPGSQQVMLQVRIAELNRTALREIGSDLFFTDGTTTLGTQMGAAGRAMDFFGGLGLAGPTTAFGVFDGGDFQIFLRALRRNSVLSILAEPNLTAMSGHEASFLAGGEFSVPIPQAGGVGGSTVTIEYKQFGIQLAFVPLVLDDERIRLRVDAAVSSIDFSLGTALGGTAVPGLDKRSTGTTVELRVGQTLAIAGLLSVDLNANTGRIPGLGDLPYIGPLFSNTSHERVEKELIVLVTPHLVAPMNPDQIAPLPGEEVKDPNDLEFYLMNRIEGRTGYPFRAPTGWDDPLGFVELMQLEQRCVSGPVGFSE